MVDFAKSAYSLFSNRRTLQPTILARPMHMLTEFFPSELPLVNAAVDQEIKALPPSLYPVAAYIAALPGKRLRPLICVGMARCLGKNDESIYPMAAALEILHCATLLHDDILDEAHARRNAPAAHLKFNDKLALLTGDAMFALAGSIVSRYGQPNLVAILSAAIQRTAEGQALESSRLFSPQFDWEHYIKVISGKTAALFEAAALSGAELALAAPKERAAAAGFGFNLGMAFQIMDDLLDFLPTPDTGKPQGGDLREGKLTPPLLCWLACCNEEERRQWLNKFSQKMLSQTDISALCAQIQTHELMAETRIQAEIYTQQAFLHLEALPLNQFNSIFTKLIHALIKQGP